MTKTRSRYGGAITFASLLMFLAITPLAAAASLGPLGEHEWGLNWATGLLVAGALAVAGGFAWGRAIVGKIPLAGKWLTIGGPVLGVVLLLAVAWINPGGFLNADDSGTATIYPGSSAAAAIAAGSSTFDDSRYEPVSAVTFYAADTAAPATAVNPVVSIYKIGVTEKAAMEGTATPIGTVTLSSGTGTINVNVRAHGTCIYDIGVDASNYYEKVIRNVDLCRAKNANGLNAVPVNTIFMDKIGTASLSLTGTSLTCSAGSTCTYSLVVRNSVADTYLHGVAVKFANVANATLDSVVTGSACELIDVSGTQYVKFSADLGSLESRTCNLSITRASGSADGSLTWTMNDLFQVNGATGFNANSNTKGASATSATTVSFA